MSIEIRSLLMMALFLGLINQVDAASMDANFFGHEPKIADRVDGFRTTGHTRYEAISSLGNIENQQVHPDELILNRGLEPARFDRKLKSSSLIDFDKLP